MAMWASAALQAHAQNNTPAVVVSVSGFDEIMADITWVAQTSGSPQAAFLPAMAGASAAPFTKFMDTSKPSGALISLDASGAQSVVGFVPVKDLTGLLGALAQQQIGPATDAGNGIKQLQAQGQTVFLKEGSGFVFLSDKAENLGTVPTNPVAQLNGLETKYNVAVSVNVQAVPQQARAAWLGQMRAGLEPGLQGLPPEQRQQIAQNFNQFEKLSNELDQVMFGFAIDATSKSIYFDMGMTAKAGTELAAQMNKMANAKSDFSGFNMPGAAALLNFTSVMAEADKAQAQLMLDTGLKQVLKELDQDQQLPSDAARAAAKDVVQKFFKVISATIDEGIMDGGAVLMLDSGLQFAAGMRVADGATLDQTFKDLIDLAKEEEDFPPVKLEAAKVGDVVFHSMTIPVDDDDAQKVLGENVELLLGTGAKSAYFAFGKNSLDLVKRVIDASAQSPGKPGVPVQLIVSLTPILKFASELQQDPKVAQVLAAIQQAQGKDHVSLVVTPQQNGFHYRIEAEEGVIRAIGAGAAGGAGNAGAPPF
jgi:hypothetical protein